MGFTDVGFMKYSLVADRYQHIAIIGMIALVAAGWSIWHERSRQSTYRAATVIPFAAVAAIGFLTWRQSGIYHDAITLYRAALEKNPACWMVQNNLGAALVKQGRLSEGLTVFNKPCSLIPIILRPIIILA